MKVGVVIEDTWAFFNEIYAEFDRRFEVEQYHRRTVRYPLFNERINRRVFHRDLANFFGRNQVVFFEWAGELLTLASQQPKSCGVVTRLHRFEMYRFADRINWDWVDRVILVSRAKQVEFAERFPASKNKTVVIPEAVSLERYPYQPRPFSGEIGILCHLSPRKRVYELILGFSELVRHRPDFRLHIGGGEHPMFRDYHLALHSLVDRLDLKDRVIFYGKVEDAQAWYENIDIFVSNSYSEGLQVSPMEAIARGRYCLAHTWAGADELLPAEDLFTTEREWMDRVLAYSDQNEAYRRERVENQYQRVREQFDVDRTKLQICELVEQVGADYPKP